MAVGLAQMRIAFAVLTEMKFANGKHPKTASEYTVMCSKVVSGNQGGVGLIWKEDDPKFEVESVLFNNSPNIVTFHLATGDEQFYVVGMVQAWVTQKLLKGNMLIVFNMFNLLNI